MVKLEGIKSTYKILFLCTNCDLKEKQIKNTILFKIAKKYYKKSTQNRLNS